VTLMMIGAVVLIPVRASQLYSRFSERRAVAGPMPSRRRPFVLVSGRLSDVRGFNDFFSSIMLQVGVERAALGRCGAQVQEGQPGEVLLLHATPQAMPPSCLFERPAPSGHPFHVPL
jgi:hypothetical protein